MELSWLNYHHLYYFWVIAREGSIAKACHKLHLAQPTVSSQLQKLERSLGGQLFERSGRSLKLTDLGRLVLQYADNIFSLGHELLDAVQGRPVGKPLELSVGVADVLPKLVVFRLLQPALVAEPLVRLRCIEGTFDELVSDLAAFKLDVVISDVPVSSSMRVKAYNHLLGSCGITFFGTKSWASKLAKSFPSSLDSCPILLPTTNASLRRSLDQWFDEMALRPLIKGEFEDSALLKVFGQEGLGVFPVP
jgi:LysR family transcriptional regulator, transcriptional activator of nhaA